MQALLKVTDLECRYGEKVILESVSFTLDKGEIACLLGPSGCGKTTLLHAIAGFQPPYGGCIALGGKPIATPDAITPPEKRHIGVVFQDYALFPHLNLQQNIAFGLKSLPAPEREARVRQLLQLVHLESFANRYPHQLSGGQQQRVALARALAPRPQLLLMDEPFSNLDMELRRSLATEVRQILREEGMAALIVTHDRDEAFAAGDKLGVLSGGRLQQWDTPENTYRTPASAAVARIVGEGSLLQGKLRQPDLIETEMGRMPLPPSVQAACTKFQIFVRNEDLLPGEHPDAVNAEVVDKRFLGSSVLYKFRLPSGRIIETTLSAELQFAPGSEVPLRINSPVIFTEHQRADLKQ
ncbi:ABC transporter ATP-binding protein [Microbulbifer thermotolerans]|uniref:ABC transporter ATP-binding protein n=1 Tax=Microbulbifer thermotolerans TaxID=252514 RepID=A0A143HMS6_MICTH|nr:ABC transporter ATP-binding protein [Microbulbifer thermotolerans]AMX02999.1 ABC transporter ATP-binding protein [Microbulbifer thermotolerans]